MKNRRKAFFVFPFEGVDAARDVALETWLDFGGSLLNGGDVEGEDEVSVVFVGGILSDVGSLEEDLEAVDAVDVVVCFEGGVGQGFPAATRMHAVRSTNYVFSL